MAFKRFFILPIPWAAGVGKAPIYVIFCTSHSVMLLMQAGRWIGKVIIISIWFRRYVFYNKRRCIFLKMKMRCFVNPNMYITGTYNILDKIPMTKPQKEGLAVEIIKFHMLTCSQVQMSGITSIWILYSR